MKPKTSNQPKQSKPAVCLKDIGPKTNPTGAKATYTNQNTFQIISAGRD